MLPNILTDLFLQMETDLSIALSMSDFLHLKMQTCHMALTISVNFIYSRVYVVQHQFVYPSLFPFMPFTFFLLYGYKPQYLIHGLYGLISMLFTFLCGFLLHDQTAAFMFMAI